MKMNAFEYLLMTFDFGRRVYLRGIVNTLQSLSQIQPAQNILEIGCGNGVGSKLIWDIFNPKSLIATDLDEKLVEIARSNNATVQFEVGNAVDLRFSSNEFDAVIGLSVIHHIPNWKDCIDEMQRIIKPKGLLIIKELWIETFQTPFGRIARHIVAHPYEDMFKENELITYLKEAGFEILVHHPHSVPIFLDDFLLVARKISH